MFQFRALMRFLLQCGLSLVLLSFTFLSVAAVEPANVKTTLNEVDARLVLIAKYMGVRPATRRLYEVSFVDPHDVYFQAIRLYDKAYQLNEEVIGNTPEHISLVKDMHNQVY